MRLFATSVCVLRAYVMYWCIIGTAGECVWLCRRLPKYWWRLFRITHSTLIYGLFFFVCGFCAFRFLFSCVRRWRGNTMFNSIWLSWHVFIILVFAKKDSDWRILQFFNQWAEFTIVFFALATLNRPCILYRVACTVHVHVIRSKISSPQSNSSVLSRWIGCFFQSSFVWVLSML